MLDAEHLVRAIHAHGGRFIERLNDGEARDMTENHERFADADRVAEDSIGGIQSFTLTVHAIGEFMFRLLHQGQRGLLVRTECDL